MSQLKGKIALITGGGMGIGRGIARRFAREGATSAIVDVDADAGNSVASAIVSELGGECMFIHADISDKEQMQSAVRRTTSAFGGLDILVNNAHAASAPTLLEDKSDAMMERSLAVMVWGAWWAMRAVLEPMKARGGGRIINFYSIDAEVGAWLNSDYNVAKSAILGLTRSAAAEWGRFNILVNAIAPTAVGTVFLRIAKENPGFWEAVNANSPVGRVGDPEDDIAPVVVFLASEASRYVTGELLHVDGGQHLPGYNNRAMGMAFAEKVNPMNREAEL
jgi:NAD(P)-dependent dehydrogenase (short-subunit alcohol dehydrogenase family)